MLNKRSMSLILLLTSGLWIQNSFGAAQIVSNTKITRLLTDTVNYGYCMAFLDANGQSQLSSIPACNNGAVSFGCQAAPAIGIAKADAARNWAAAQLAFVSDTNVYLVLDDALTYTGNYCVVKRIDNLP